jgi:hypothetical protein
MRPCPSCGTAIPNDAQICPDCGASTPVPTYEGPPPETGPGVSGGPEEKREVIKLLVLPLIVGVSASVIAVNLWGPWGIVAGILVTGAAFVIFGGLQLF